MVTNEDLKINLECVKEEIFKRFEAQIEKLESRIGHVEIENETLKRDNARLKKENMDMKDEIKYANIAANIVLIRTNNLEQHTRKDSIRIFGVCDENKNETVTETSEKTIQMLKKIGMTTTKDDISIAHRLGPSTVPNAGQSSQSLLRELPKHKPL